MRTVGEILKEKRLKLGMGLEEVEKATKIRKNTLIDLERGNWSKLPPPTFIKGFIRNYGDYLGLNSAELLAFYRREYDERQNTKPLTPVGIKRTRFAITPTVVIFSFIGLVLVVVSAYLFMQYRSFTGAPKLEVTEPKNNLQTSSTEVSVVGKTYSDAILKINGQTVELSPGGTFSVAVALVEGVNDVTITSENQFGKISTEKRTVLVELPNVGISPTPAATGSAQLTPVPQAQPLKLVLKIEPQSSWLHIEVDGNLAFEGVLVKGSTKVFEGKEMIKLITGNAGSTKAVFNDKPEEVLGNSGQRVVKEYRK